MSNIIITVLIVICIVLLYALVEQYAWRRLNERRAAAYRHRCDLLAERLSIVVRNETMLRHAIRAMQRECHGRTRWQGGCRSDSRSP